MMIDTNAKNMTIFGLLQIGTILFGIGASALLIRILGEHFVPRLAHLWYRFGMLLCLIPLVWVIVATYLRNFTESSNKVKLAVMLLGIAIWLVLCAGVIIAVVVPLWNADWGFES